MLDIGAKKVGEQADQNFMLDLLETTSFNENLLDFVIWGTLVDVTQLNLNGWGKSNKGVHIKSCAPITERKKLPEKLRRYAPTKGNQEKTDRIIDIIDIIDIVDLIDR